MIKEFLTKYNKSIVFVLRNLLVVLFIILLLHLVSFVDITVLIPLRFFGVILLYLVFFLVLSYYQGCDKKKKESIEKITKYLFLFILFLTTLNSSNFIIRGTSGLIFPFNNNDCVFILSWLGIATGLSTFYLNRERIDIEIKKGEEKEQDNEEIRETEFDNKYQKINKIPIVKKVVKWIYREGWSNVLILITILVVASTLRMQSFEHNLSDSANYDKYRSEIPIAIKAYSEGDFFHAENNFYRTVDKQGTNSSYGRFPFYPWLTYPLVTLSDTFSFSTMLKTMLLVIDMFIFLQLYLFFSKIFNKKFALIGVALFSINIFTQYYFAIPVEDKFGLLFFLLGANHLFMKKYYSAYLFAGISFLAKESFLLITVPFWVVIEIFKTKKTERLNSINKIIKNTIIFLTPYLLYHFLLRNLPVFSPIERYGAIFITVLIFILLSYFNKSTFSTFKLPNFLKIGLFILTGIIAISFGSLIFEKIKNLSLYSLTTTNLIFNWDMYQIMIKQVVARYFGSYFWVFIFLGLMLILSNIKKNIACFALLIASLTYLMIGSTAITMHNYYRHIFVILFIVLFIFVLRKIYHLFFPKKYVYIYLLLLLIPVFAKTYTDTANNFQIISAREDQGFEKAADYIKENTEENTKIIYSDYKLYAETIFLSFRDPAQFNPAYVRELVKKEGFLNTMRKYNTTCYLSIGESDFSDLLYLFEEISKTETLTREEVIIYRLENKEKYYTLDSFDVRKELQEEIKIAKTQEVLRKYNPRQYFELVTVIGDVYIYKLK